MKCFKKSVFRILRTLSFVIWIDLTFAGGNPQLDIASPSDVCRILFSVSSVHPTLLSKMASEDIEVAHILAGTKEVTDSLKEGALAYSVDEVKVTGIERVLADTWDVPGLDFRSFIRDLPALFLRDLRTDVLQLRVRKELLAYFALAPFLYNADGSPSFNQINELSKSQLNKTIQEMTVFQIRDRLGFNRFERAFRGELNPTLNEIAEAVKTHPSGAVLENFTSFRNNFIQRGYTNFIPKNVKIQSVFLEEMHPLVALYRSLFAADSQTKRSSLFTLLDSVRSFKIMSIDSGKIRPLGHALVIELDVGQAKFPFLIGINGVNLSEDTVPIVMQLMSTRYKADQVMVPDYNLNNRLTDQESVRSTLQNVRASVQKIKLPNEWLEIRNILEQRDPVKEHENALFANIEYARIIDVKSEFPIDSQRLLTPPQTYVLPSPYFKNIDPIDLEASARLVLKEQIQKAFPEFNVSEIESLIGVSHLH